MPWLTPPQRTVLSRVLSPNPRQNRKENADISHVSFYSSELKGAQQLIGHLKDEAAGKGDKGTSGNRYRNTLRNLGLIGDDDKPTTAGNAVMAWAKSNAKDAADPKLAAERVDRITYENLLRLLKDEPESKPALFFRGLLANLKPFVGGIPAKELPTVAEDLELLYILQLIHSSGDEVARYWWLTPAERTEFQQAWLAAEKSWNKDYTPADRLEATLHDYIGIASRNQKDIRFRVRGFLKSWIDLRNDLPGEAGGKESIVDEDGEPPRYTLPSKSPPVDLDAPRQLLMSGCPGSGKSYHLSKLAREGDGTHWLIRTTFHAETSYFDFVGTYRPAPVYVAEETELLDGSGRRANVPGRPIIDYRFVPGPFTNAFIYALTNPTWKVVLIIEEINRANASAVFGDVLQLLDRAEDTQKSHYAIEPQPSLREFLAQHGALDADDVMRLPSNLFLWATMNNADQGVQPLDSAFRRRWAFRYLGHETKCETARSIKYGGKTIDWDHFRTTVNTRLLEAGAHEDKLIGPYFLSVAEAARPDTVLNKLFLYLWDDVLRYQRERLFRKELRSFAAVESDWKGGDGVPLGPIA